MQVYRQHFRGQMWHVIQDESSNQFFRLNDAAYRFVAMLDGRRTVADVWRICNEELGDGAPTQGEAIQLLGQLYTSNLIQAELPPDSEGLFQRYKKRVGREVKGYVSNLLFIRVPLFDPDNILNELLPAVRWVFSWMGAVLLLGLMSTAFYFLAGRFGDLTKQSENFLDPKNLPLVFASFWVVKIFHEFGHAFACKKFGQDAGTGGEVHTMGVMFLVFTPLPYVDATSAHAFRKKWHRVIVGAGGMLVELGIASIAAIVWARTSPGPVHAIAYNVMFIASVSTLMFNANPLLRFDGYYILSDITEIANLNPRSKQYLYYLIRKYAWGVRRARNPAHTRGEKIWFVFYGIASTVYRVFIVTRILLFVSSKLFFIGVILAAAALVAWLLVPLGKFVKYLATNNELMRVRARAVGTVVATLAIIVIGIGIVPADDHTRMEGVVEPVELAFIYPRADGFIRSFLPSDQMVAADGEVLVDAENPELEIQLRILQAERRSSVARKRMAEAQGNTAAAQSWSKVLSSVDFRIKDMTEQIDALHLRAPIAGRWISPDIEKLQGAYVKRGQQIGLVASDEVIILAIADQDISAKVYEDIKDGDSVEIRLWGRPDHQFTGTVRAHLPAGRKDLPSKALGYAAGGSAQTVMTDPEGRRTTEPFFQLLITPDAPPGRLRSGQRVVVRLTGPSKPLAVQWWRSILQLVQRRFQT